MDASDTALVVIDVQGRLADLMVERDRLLERIAVAIRGVRLLDIPVLWCQQAPRALGPTVEVIARCLEGIDPIDKTSFSCLGEPAFRQRLTALRRSHCVLCGIETHVCVFQTARDLIREGFSTTVLADAVSSRSAADRALGMDRMRQQGVCLSSVEMALFDLLGDARHPRFKAVAALVK